MDVIMFLLDVLDGHSKTIVGLDARVRDKLVDIVISRFEAVVLTL